MKVQFQFTVSVAGEGFSYRPGEVAELDAELAANWEACGHGVIVPSPQPETPKVDAKPLRKV